VSMRLVSLTPISLCVVLATVAGCAGHNAGRGTMEATVEPLTEAEFDAFATDVAEQIVAWLERGQVSLPVTIRPPTLEGEPAECEGVSKAFCRRLAEGLSDRLLGAIRFGTPSRAAPRLRCGVSFVTDGSDQKSRTLMFRLWDADSSLEICRQSRDYQVRPRHLEDLHRRLEEHRLAARTPRSGSEPSVAVVAPSGTEPIATGAGAARPEAVAARGEATRPQTEAVPVGAGVPGSTTSVSEATPTTVAAAPVGPARADSRDEGPVAEEVSVSPEAVVATPSEQASAAMAGVTPPAEAVEKARLVQAGRMPAKRTVRIDRHEQGLADLVQEQAVHFTDRTIAGELGRVIFLDQRAWEEVHMEVRRSWRTHGGRLSVELLIQADDRPAEADIRVVYLDAQGRQVEASRVQTYYVSPSYTKRIALHSSKAGAAEYIVLVARG
jgi:hypothetical protein